jgi:hypothetical protein
MSLFNTIASFAKVSSLSFTEDSIRLYRLTRFLSFNIFLRKAILNKYPILTFSLGFIPPFFRNN